MMRRIILLLFIISSTFLCMAQEDEEEIPLPTSRRVQSKIGGAGGFTQNILFMDLKPLNEYLSRANAAPFNKTPLLLLGGQGYGYFMIIQNLRIGGMGAGGSINSKYLDDNNIRRNINLSVTYSGVTVDYVIPVIPKLDVTAGILIGGGGMTITMTRDLSSPKVWDNIWNEYGSITPETNEYTRHLSGSFFVYQPSINIEYAILRWLGVRIGVGYYGVAGGDWKMDNDYELLNVPSSIKSKGWMINSGIFLGTFVY